MMRFSTLILVCLALQVNAQCSEAYNNFYDSASKRYSIDYSEWQAIAISIISEKRMVIDNSYDSILHFNSSGKKFCKGSPFCIGLADEIKVNAYTKDSLINRIVTSTYNSEGKFKSQFYFWMGKLIYAFQSFEYFSNKAPKDQWVNRDGMLGWEAEVFVCDQEVYKVDVKGVNEKRKLLKSEYDRKRPWSVEGSNAKLIIDDLLLFHCEWMILDFVKPRIEAPK